ncbi:amidohydrolase family protein [Dyadobacter psychrotolerans]|uniref:Amidohydrolase n=1 Tax=Dyadobacter psychrotolerans TaxID=2541721 RepID=A0A4R5DKG8_9BACT|nr:amidohydrolase family protein [Dyadobacter psychrotolerans]TDE11335.1 amidohydrolase [Dyadobacter psychrotolerans]
MVIDSHQHFWIFDPVKDSWITPEMEVIRRDFLPADLKPILETNEIYGCVAVQADQTDAETEFLLHLAAADDFIKGVVGWIDLRSDNIYDRLEAYSQFEQLKGFRHIAQGQPEGFLLRPEFVKGVGQLAAFDFTYDILIYANQLSEAFEFAKQLPKVRFVLDHMAKPFIKKGETDPWIKDIKKLAELPNVSCKVSGLVTEADWSSWQKSDFRPYLDVVFDAFGTKRLLFGSDWPVCLVAGEYAEIKSIITDYISSLQKNEQADVMGNNAVKFYNLD